MDMDLEQRMKLDHDDSNKEAKKKLLIECTPKKIVAKKFNLIIRKGES